ncbi:MAG: glucosyltransferase domain-containing protein [Arenimonas sp.]
MASGAAVETNPPAGWPDARALPLLVAAAVFLLVYGSELGSFTLSIDEEVASFVSDNGRTWLQQGRWGMALLTLLLPNFEAIPLLSTLLFGAGLVLAGRRALGDLRLRGAGALLFVVVHTGFPVWLHIAEFNTLAGGFGLGLAAAAFGAGLLLQPDRASRMGGIALLAFAVSVYQTLVLYSALYLLLALHARWRDQTVASAWSQRIREAAPVAGAWALSLLVYWLVQQGAMLAFGLASSYVGGYLQIERLQDDPAGSLRSIVHFVGALLLGRHPIYLGWGLGILFLVWPGLWPWRAAAQSSARREHALEVLVLAAAMMLVALPALPSVATLPVRAFVAWPLLAAWLASRLGPLFEPRPRWLLGLALGYFAVVASSIGASMFYADRVVHAADAALARELGPAIEQAAGATRPITITLVGQRAFPAGGQIQRAEIFGDSFFEHDGGNVHRVALFMHLQGYPDLQGVWLSTRPALVAAAQSMPAWPAPGSVRPVDGVVIVKLGEPTPQQLASP